MFTYSQEEGTVAATMDCQIDEEVKEDRLDKLMVLQQGISLEINKNNIGKECEVLIEGMKKGYYYGRTYGMAPEIDGEVLVKGKDLSIGDFVTVRIIKALEYDLIGEII